MLPSRWLKEEEDLSLSLALSFYPVLTVSHSFSKGSQKIERQVEGRRKKEKIKKESIKKRKRKRIEEKENEKKKT